MSFGPKYAAPPASSLTLPPDISDTSAGIQTAAQEAADAARTAAASQKGRKSTILTVPGSFSMPATPSTSVAGPLTKAPITLLGGK